MVDDIPLATKNDSGSIRAVEVGDGYENSTDLWTSLFISIAAGKAAALHDLYDLAAPQLYGLALWRTGSADDAGEVVQEVFVRVAEQGKRLEKVKNPKAWLLTVTRRLAIDWVRRREVRRSEPLDAYQYLEAECSDSDRAADAQLASQMLAGLPAKQRDVIYLRHYADCTFAEIGRIVGVPTFTASSRYRLGLKRLRNQMGNQK